MPASTSDAGQGPPEQADALADWLAAEAARLGFVAFGIAPADAAPEAGRRLRQWLAEGHHGQMLWMEARAEERASPKGLWPDVRSVVMLGLPYTPAVSPFRHDGQPSRATISVYALGRDYHDVVKSRLKALARGLTARAPAPLKVFVDTAPVMEKPLAEAAGLGWQGKHTNLLSRHHGNWLFLGALYSSLDLPARRQPATMGSCGSCTRCLDACPTGAIIEPYRLDARACISYLTIEHRGPIDEQYREALGTRIYGCDDCLAVCPWNRFATSPADPALAARPDLVSPHLAEFLALDDAAFRARFSGSPVKRIGRDRFVRNCLYAAGNSADPSLGSAVAAHLDSPDEAVADAARWALDRLAALSTLSDAPSGP